MSNLLTHSRIESFRKCRKRHWYEYELGLRREVDSRALRMGSAYHAGLDQLKQGQALEMAVATARALYDATPPGEYVIDWEMERETVATMIAGYQWRWQAAGMQLVLATEKEFCLPVVNPETEAASTIWRLAGKIDGIVRLEDGRLAVLEHKLLSENLAADSDWWQRLQMDPQVSLYVYAARQCGYDVATVLYDVGRKPTMKPTPVSLLDELGARVVLDAKGNRVKTERGVWRQTGDTAKGFILQSRPMTPEEYAAKVADDIGARPDYYFARVEIPRLDQDIEECRREVWEIQKTIRAAQNSGYWFRTVSRDSCPYCPYFGLCSSKVNLGDGALPEGFIYVENRHPELSQVANQET